MKMTSVITYPKYQSQIISAPNIITQVTMHVLTKNTLQPAKYKITTITKYMLQN